MDRVYPGKDVYKRQVADVSPLWQLVDLCNALMALPNLAALLLLAPRALSCLAEWAVSYTHLKNS